MTLFSGTELLLILFGQKIPHNFLRHQWWEGLDIAYVSFGHRPTLSSLEEDRLYIAVVELDFSWDC